MGSYDIFVKNEHPVFIQKLMIKNNVKLVKYLFQKCELCSLDKIKFLEIGPGKGYMKKAIEVSYLPIDYYALDRNALILEQLNIDYDKKILGNVNEVNIDEKFDVIFAGYVIEHFSNGLELYETISKLKEALNEGGMLVLQFPECSKLKMEFWNIDYTHCFPTTKRNINMILQDCHMTIINMFDINGLLFTKHLENRFEYYFRRVFMLLYNYKFWSFILYPFYRKHDYDLSNFFYKSYGLFKEENAIVFAKK